MKKLYDFYENDTRSIIKKFYMILDVVFIIISIIPLMFQLSVNNVLYIEVVTVTYFIIDYLLRFSISKDKYKRGYFSYILYVISFYAVIDILAIIPVFLAINPAFKSLRVIRLIKTFRFFKIFKYSNSISILVKVFKKEASLLITVFVIALIFVFISALMIYQFEHLYQPDAFRNFFDAIWWSFATLTTVGYGDIYPISTEGRLIAVIVSFFGIAIVALPSGIIAAGLIDEIKK